MSVAFRFKSNIGKRVLAVTDSSMAAQATIQTRQDMADIVAEYVRFMKAVPELTAEAIYEAMLPVKERADVLCPFKTGAMRASGYLIVTSQGNTPRVEIGYGAGGNPPYTPFVHEDLQAFHEPPTQAKWLETALREQADEIPQRIARAIQSGLSLQPTAGVGG